MTGRRCTRSRRASGARRRTRAAGRLGRRSAGSSRSRRRFWSAPAGRATRAAIVAPVPEGQVSHRNAIRFGRALAGRPLVRVEAPEPRLAGQRIPERLEGDERQRRRGGRQAPPAALRERPGAALAPDDARGLAPAAGRRARRGPAGCSSRSGRPTTSPPSTAARACASSSRASRCRGTSPEPGRTSWAPRSTPAPPPRRALARLEPTRQVGEALVDQRVVAGVATSTRARPASWRASTRGGRSGA